MTTGDLTTLSPQKLAEALVAARGDRPAWLDEFSEELDRRRAGRELERLLTVWGLSQSEAARLFGVSRQAVSKWLERGVPSERLESLADLAAATDLLVRYVKRDRVPAVVRRQFPAANGRSLLELVGEGRTRRVLEVCRAMFDFASVLG